MKKSIIILLALVTGIVPLFGKITVLEESESYIRLKFTLPTYRFEESELDYKKIICDDADYIFDEGKPEVPYFSEIVGIPEDGDIQVNILRQKEIAKENIKITRCPEMTIKKDQVSYKSTNTTTIPKLRSFYPDQIVKKDKSAFLGDRNFISFHIFPFRYNESNKQLKISREIDIEIIINGDKTAKRSWQLSNNYIDPYGDEFCINNDYSKKWRKEQAVFSVPTKKSSDYNGIDLVVNEEGLYKVTYSFLKDQISTLEDSLGVDLGWDIDDIDPKRLQLESNKQVEPVYFYGEEDGSFDKGDYFEFYGYINHGKERYHDAYTIRNTYKLVLKDDFGSRMAVENGGIMVTQTSEYTEPTYYDHHVHFETQSYYEKMGNAYNYDSDYYLEDPFFWRKVKAPNLEIIPIELQYPVNREIDKFEANVSLFGLTYGNYQNDHHAIVRINSAIVGSEYWTGQNEQVFHTANEYSNSFLNHGENSVFVSLPGDTPSGETELIALDYIDLKYWREYKTDEDFIRFKKPSFKPNGLFQFKLEGFQSKDVSVYKIGSSKMENLRIESYFELDEAPYYVTFQDTVNSDNFEYFATTEANKKTPLEIRIDIQSDLKARTNNYDALLITSSDFVETEGVELFRSTWQEQGFNPLVVDVQDIYDEFNHGITSADAIRDFLQYAYNMWSEPQLKNVLLVGDGTYDTRENSTSTKYNIIPYKKVWTWKHGATPSDNYYSCLVGDDAVPEIGISRISVWQAEQILDIAQKSYITLNNPKLDDLGPAHVVLTAGGKVTDSLDVFSQQEEIIKERMISDDYRVTRVYTTTQSVSSDFYGSTFTLKDGIDRGATFLQFMGHGGGRIWADYNLLNLNDLATLNNDYYPFVSSLACYAASFDYPGDSSINESFINEADKGAINTLGFSGLGYLNQDLTFGTALADGFFRQKLPTSGDVVKYTIAKSYFKLFGQAKKALTEGCVLLGDPNAVIHRPNRQLTVTTDKEIYSVGDTVRVNMQAGGLNLSEAKLYVLDKDDLIENIAYYIPVILGEYNHTFVIPESISEGSYLTMRVESYDNEQVYIGEKTIGVGNSNFYDVVTIPAEPTVFDSVYVSTKIVTEDEIETVNLVYSVGSTKSRAIIPMSLKDGSDNEYEISEFIPKYNADLKVTYSFEVTTTEAVVKSDDYRYTILGPDLHVHDCEFVSNNGIPSISYTITNLTPIATIPCDLKIYKEVDGEDGIQLYDDAVEAFAGFESRDYVYQMSDFEVGNFDFRVVVNEERIFSEMITYNNEDVIDLPINYQLITNQGGSVTSLDGIATLEIPATYLTEAFFNVNVGSFIEPNTQPDIEKILMPNNIESSVFEITCLSEEVADSTGLLLNGNLDLKIQFNSADSLTSLYATNDEIDIYRWHDEYQKWIFQGGLVSLDNGEIRASIGRLGKFTLLRNRDKIRPTIDPNVQEQEFTQGGYVSGTGTISVVLSDANGIDIIDNRFKFYLNGDQVNEEDLVISLNEDNLNNIPIKYHLDLPEGNYSLVIDCTDINGNFNTIDITFKVTTDFDIFDIANYPNPVVGKAIEPVNDGRTRFTYTLTDDADWVKIIVYTVSGRKVIELKGLPTSVGYHEYPRTIYGWDCKDRDGYDLANGVYFYKVIAKKGGKKIEKIQKMAILK